MTGYMFLATSASESALSSGLFVFVLPLVTALVGGSVAAAVVTHIYGAADKRREHYAEAVACLIAWCEYPYVVRRRVDNESATLERLAQRGHDLQERIGLAEAWVAAEDSAMGDTYSELISLVKSSVSPLLADAWAADPISTPAGMVLGGWGKETCGMAREAINAFRRSTRSRFGWRRLF